MAKTQLASPNLFIDCLFVAEEPRAAWGDAAESRVGTEIRRLRHAAGYSQDALARAAGVDCSEVSVLEGGDHTASLETLRLVADALGTKASDILAGAGC
jgi:DNA-binding XRE family transcriptional regulator